MGKKSCEKAIKISKHDKKQPLNNLIKNLRPKVIITDPSNFKDIVQKHTGNGKCSSVELSPPPPFIPASPSPLPTWEQLLFAENQNNHQDVNSSLDVSFDSSCFATPLEGSPERQKMEFYRDLEAMLMEMDCDYGMFQQQQVCLYDYDLSNFI